MNEIMVGALAEFADGDYRILTVDDLEVGIFRRGKKLFAYENRCPHYGGPACQGKIFNRVEEMIGEDRTSLGLRFASEEHIVCPWHGYEFSITTGRHPGDPKVALKPVDIGVRDGQVYLKLPD
jgi:nitrite reductase (NADH) small subunit